QPDSFYFHRASGTRQYLPSFPTRRSSDLMVSLSVSEQENGYYLILMKEKDAIESIDEYDGMAWYALVWIGKHTNAIILIDRLDGDRKSTRLNSSHVSISYAVFCLKKKQHH